MAHTVTHKTVCQVCHNCCPIEVDVVDGRAVKILGNKANRHYDGFTCVKGRGQLDYHYSPDRLLHSLKRGPDGGYAPIWSEQAMDEIAVKLTRIIERHGPRAVSAYFGTQAFQTASASMPVAKGFMAGIGSPMVFESVTIDQPGKAVAPALHGTWLGGKYGPNEADVLLLIGANPLVSMLGLPLGNHGKWLGDKLESGGRLIVIDPRRTETARRAHLFLQPLPGHDVAILAAMTRIILAEDLIDSRFVTDNVTGIDELRSAVAPFEPSLVAAAAEVDVADLETAARMYAAAGRGYIDAGTGPNMAQSGTLLEYLILNLGALCGDRRRAGETVADPVSLYPPLPAVAQALPPYPAGGLGEAMRVRGLGHCPAGMPVSGLAEEILTPGEGQVRVLFSVGGNPIAAWPDQIRTAEAMSALELLVQIDPFMSATAHYADYVIAPPMALETPHVTHVLDFLQAAGIGPGAPYAQYGPAVVDPPEGSDLCSEWQFFYGLGQRMGVQIAAPHPLGLVEPVPLDMAHPPTEEELLDIVCQGSRLPLDVVRRHPDGVEGALAAEPATVVLPGDPSTPTCLDVGNPQMMADLAAVADNLGAGEHIGGTAAGDDMLLISRREMHATNSSYNAMAARGGRRHNPAFINPVDATRLGVGADDVVRIASPRASVLAVVSLDESVRPGVVSMSHAYGNPSPDVDTPLQDGSSTARLADVTVDFDRYSGQPRMSAIPVTVTPASL
ncbi:molybdopterin-containing oxidoreductase family protein [Mycolicibacterium vaccae]|uniref:molybdopterin-containing oxidoreductase family protein n=1 Tax=Mycolicibacterium vaccae TaxID=1810 RepID=UPI003CFF2496